MNLSKLFEIQKVLDDRIIETHGLQGKDLLPNLILALQVELGELANEWRGFKHWSKDQEPRTKSCRVVKWGSRPGGLNESEFYNPLLEEYVDCLHFLLSIGLQLKVIEKGWDFELLVPQHREDVIISFTELMRANWGYADWQGDYLGEYDYFQGFELFIWLGNQLGFTWEQIEQAYLEKNKVNHERQESGY